MNNTFVSALNYQLTAPVLVARTQNGMRVRTTTSNPALDLFGSIGASRGKDVTPLFAQVYAQNKDLALRIAQWARDVRGGASERQIYRDILLWLEANDPHVLVASKLLGNIAEIGRFDDLLIFTDAAVQEKADEVFIRALLNGNSLAAKWAPRKGVVAWRLRTRMGLSPKQYRKLIVHLTSVVETQMCARQWNEINFSHVPSQAMTKYMTAFHRNAPEVFAAYKEALKRNDGTAKVNAGAVYPHDIIKMLGGAFDLSSPYRSYSRNVYQFNQVAQSMWEALPNYMNGANVLAVVDNSGSMQSTVNGSSVTALDVAASLGMYTAYNSRGAFKDLSISFSDNAQFVRHSGTIDKRLQQICSVQWGSTNLHSVFDLILRHAVANRVPINDMPAMLLIMSDMQFNSCVRYDDSALAMIRRKYEDAGYEMPQIVFWNLMDYGNKPVKFNDAGVALISGYSPAIMEAVLAVEVDKFTPESVMMKAVCKERYNW